MLFVRKWVKELCKSMLDNYKDWKQTEYSFTNTKTWISFWTASWIYFLCIEWQNKWFWGYFEKRYIFNTIQKIISKQINEKWYIPK